MPTTATAWLRPLLFASLAAPLVAQTGLLPAHWPMTDVHVWADKANHPGQFGRMITASISNFGYPDAVFLVGEEVMLMTAPALMSQITPLPGTAALPANDLCNVATESSQHTLAICGATGLTLWNKDNPTATVQVPGSSWTGAGSVSVVRGEAQVVGKNAQGTAVVRADLSNATELTAWNVAGVLAVTTLDFEGDGTDEIGIVTTSGIQIRKANGAIVLSHAETLLAAEAGRQTTPLGDALSCLCNVAGHSSQFLVTFHQYWQNATQLPSQNSKNLRLADLDGDGWHDVTLSWTGTAGGPVPSLDVLWNLGGGQIPWYAYQTGGGVNVMLPHGTQQTANPAPPLLADLDGDGATDSIIPLQGHNKFSVDYSPFAPNATATVAHDGITLVNLSGTATLAPLDEAVMHLSLAHGNIPATATHIELQAYRWDVLGGAAPQYQANWRVLVPLVTTPPEEPIPTPPETLVSAPLLGDDMLNHAVLFMLRYVLISGEQVVHAWPPQNRTATLNASIQAHLTSQPGVTGLALNEGGIPVGGVTTITPVPAVEPPTGFEEDDGE